MIGMSKFSDTEWAGKVGLNIGKDRRARCEDPRSETFFVVWSRAQLCTSLSCRVHSCKKVMVILLVRVKRSKERWRRPLWQWGLGLGVGIRPGTHIPRVWLQLLQLVFLLPHLDLPSFSIHVISHWKRWLFWPEMSARFPYAQGFVWKKVGGITY